MKGHIEVTEDKNMTHSFGQRVEYEVKEETIENVLYDTNKTYGEYNTSGYAIDSTYKTTYKVDDPIVIFNPDPYHRIETRDIIGSAGGTLTEEYKQEITYSKPLDDY
jgi:hypothetical protein